MSGLNAIMTFSEFNRAIIAMGAKPESPGFHKLQHSGAAKVWTWKEQKQQAYTLETSGRRFALRLTGEKHMGGTKDRVILFGKQLFGKRRRSGNTARATFNSSNENHRGYFLKPALAAEHNLALRAQMSGRTAFPKYIGGRIHLAGDIAPTVLRSFLQALSFIEEIKNQPKELLAKGDSDEATYTVEDFDDLTLFDEGKRTGSNRKIPKRSAKLRELVVAYYKVRSEDGRLRCYVDNWAPKVAVRGNIVQIHHDEALAGYPESGRKLTFREAIKFLFPLCPNCHRMLEAKPGGGRYTIPELRNLMQRKGETQ